MIARRLADGGQILFDVDKVSVEGLTGTPKIRFEHGGTAQQLDCDFIGGCDGFHGICRPSMVETQLCKPEIGVGRGQVHGTDCNAGVDIPIPRGKVVEHVREPMARTELVVVRLTTHLATARS